MHYFYAGIDVSKVGKDSRSLFAYQQGAKMNYLKWFDALSALYANNDSLPEDTRRGLGFLGNMLMPTETHIIRLGADTPKVFTPADKFLSTRNDLLGDGFYLPGEGVVVEDEFSSIGFVDMAKGKRGVREPKLFVYIEPRTTSARERKIKTLADLLDAAIADLYLPVDSFLTIWGMIMDVENLNIEGRQVEIKVSTCGMSILSASTVYQSYHSDWFEHYLKSEKMTTPETSVLCQMIERYSDTLGQNLQQGLLQVAYHNAVVETK